MGEAPGLGPQSFICKKFQSPIFALMTTLTILICLLCVYVTVKIQFDNTGTSTYEYSSYSPYARSLCSIARLGPPIQKFWILP